MNYWACSLETEKDHDFSSKHHGDLLGDSWQRRHTKVDRCWVVTCMVLGLLLKLLSVLGVEPEPFEIGDHIVEASGKLCLLDKLLSFLYSGYVMLEWRRQGRVGIGRRGKLGSQTTLFSHRLSRYSSQHKHCPICCTLLTTWKKSFQYKELH